MKTISLSYSRQDYFFAEMLAVKLDEKGFRIWRDQGSIRAGDDWRQSIEDGIRDWFAVVVALSASSAQSAYVTYEWAYAIGMSKPVIPVKLSECTVHPKLEPTQHLDFSYPRALPWDALMQRLNEVESEKEPTKEKPSTSVRTPKTSAEVDEAANEILAYLNHRGFTMASFDRLREHLGPKMTDKMFERVIESHPGAFRRAVLKGARPGVAKRVP